jgi:hypothetical protein
MIGLLSFYPLEGKTPGGTVGVTSPSAPGQVDASMDERDWLAEQFQRPRLRAVAYRMLGSTGEADDVLQQA